MAEKKAIRDKVRDPTLCTLGVEVATELAERYVTTSTIFKWCYQADMAEQDDDDDDGGKSKATNAHMLEAYNGVRAAKTKEEIDAIAKRFGKSRKGVLIWFRVIERETGVGAVEGSPAGEEMALEDEKMDLEDEGILLGYSLDEREVVGAFAWDETLSLSAS